MPQISFEIKSLPRALGAAIGFYIAFAAAIHFGGLAEFDAMSLLVSVPTVIGVLFLILLGIISSGDVSWSRQGFDFSVLAFGAILSTLTLQIFMQTPALPRLLHGSLGKWLTGVVKTPERATWIFLSCVLFLSLLTCFITAIVELHLSNAARTRATTRQDAKLANFNYALGVLSLSLYTGVVCGGVEV
jgi:hypothetical protein